MEVQNPQSYMESSIPKQGKSRPLEWLCEGAMLAAGAALTYFALQPMDKTTAITITSASVMNYAGIKIAGLNGLMVSNLVQAVYLGMQFGRDNHNPLMWLTDSPALTSAAAAGALCAHVWSDIKMLTPKDGKPNRYTAMWAMSAVFWAVVGSYAANIVPVGTAPKMRLQENVLTWFGEPSAASITSIASDLRLHMSEQGIKPILANAVFIPWFLARHLKFTCPRSKVD